MNVWLELNSSKLDQQQIDETAAFSTIQQARFLTIQGQVELLSYIRKDLFNICKVLAQSVFRFDESCSILGKLYLVIHSSQKRIFRPCP